MEREEKKMTTLLLKPHSTPATLLWLQANYETVEGVCIPRNAMYSQYVEFCRSNGMMPVNAASFGKIIRQQFSGLTTRRLGTRGQSRYHYYGLAAKSDTNLYAQSSFTRYGFKNSKQPKIPGMTKVTTSSGCYVSNPLFNFPTKDVLKNLPKDISRSDTETILIMYTLHCQQLIDFSIHLHFQEVKEYIIHFWQGFPSHLAPFLEHPSILSLIGSCDTITYRAIAHATMPCVMLEEVPAGKAEDVIRLAEKITDWLVLSLANFPLVLRRMKLHAARTLLHSVRRQASLNHLCSTLRFILTSDVHLKQMLTDWEHLDLGAVADEMKDFSLVGSKINYASQIIISCCKDLERLLKTRPQLAELRDWMKGLVERCVTTQIDPVKTSGERLKNFACHFVLIWSSIGTRFLRELTLLGAHSFGTFHLLYLMLTDYGAQLVESLIMEDRIQRLLANIELGHPLQSNDFDAGTLCDAQCPCKMMCQHHDEEMGNGEEFVNKNLPVDSTLLNSSSTSLMMMMHGGGGGGGGDTMMSDSTVEMFSNLPQNQQSEASRYCQIFSTEQSTEFCPASQTSHPYSSQSQPENPEEELISRPSCSFQDLTTLPTCEYIRNGVGKIGDSNSSGGGGGVGVFKNEMKLFVPSEAEEEEDEDVICEQFPGTNLHTSCLNSPGMTDYYSSPPSHSGMHDESANSSNNNSSSSNFCRTYCSSSSTVSNGGQLVDNYYSAAEEDESMTFLSPLSSIPMMMSQQNDHHHH